MDCPPWKEMVGETNSRPSGRNKVGTSDSEPPTVFGRATLGSEPFTVSRQAESSAGFRRLGLTEGQSGFGLDLSRQSDVLSFAAANQAHQTVWCSRESNRVAQTDGGACCVCKLR